LAGDSNWLLTPPLTISLAGPRQMLAFSLVHVSAWTKGWYKTQSKNISSSILTPQLIPWYTSPLRSDVHQRNRSSLAPAGAPAHQSSRAPAGVFIF